MTPAQYFRGTIIYLVAAVGLVGFCLAEGPQRTRDGLREPVFRTSNRATGTPGAKAVEHPLAPALRIAENALAHMRSDIRDYSCTLVKRERIDGTLNDHEFIFMKVRHERTGGGRVVTPFSVYMYFLKPAAVKAREVLFVKGKNNSKLVAHEGGPIIGLVTVSLDPTSKLAMRGNRYPITEVGIENLVRKLVEVAREDMKFGECEVKFYKGAKINGRVCTCIEVMHPVPRKNFRFHKARIFVDDERQIPIRYAAWDWPKKQGGKPILLEEYTYLDLKLNVGLTDADFDRTNDKYRF